MPTVRFENNSIAVVGRDILEALREADAVLKEVGYNEPIVTEDGAPMGQVYINFVDLK